MRTYLCQIACVPFLWHFLVDGAVYTGAKKDSLNETQLCTISYSIKAMVDQTTFDTEVFHHYRIELLSVRQLRYQSGQLPMS